MQAIVCERNAATFRYVPDVFRGGILPVEAQYRTRDGRLIFKVDAENQKEIFKQIAVTQEVFEAETECGCCHSKEIRFRVRTVDKHDFYEVACGSCGARFEFGQHKNGRSLFPKRRAEDGAVLPNRGWAKWEPFAAAPLDKAEYKNGGRQTHYRKP